MALISGTTGQVKQIEGINIRLTGQLAATYNVYYRVHVTKFWLASLDNERKSFRNTWVRSSNRSN